MGVLQAILLGATQGVTEFLPVSSSGHLVLLQNIFGISEGTLLFDTMTHVGTLIAVFAVLWKDVWAILKKPFQLLTGFLIIATIPTVVGALVFKDAIEKAFTSADFLGWAFLLTSLALVVSDLLANRSRTPIGQSRQMSVVDALVVGILQAVAIIPGVSRSGFTLSGALARRLDKDFAARFSFLLSIPAILGALVLQVKGLLGGTAVRVETAPLIAGTFTAAVVGFFSVRLMLKLVKEHRLWGFAIYTGFLGIAVLIFGVL
ncbi:MAG: undecaprenyl-diphosphate phosphatase [Treponema sp.]|jgi:undecaprenyl-diphosphatase|nr:undecaprenyl-diphosphate phosphatase [Treponema sp.]